jgi:hypothetical protein
MSVVRTLLALVATLVAATLMATVPAQAQTVVSAVRIGSTTAYRTTVGTTTALAIPSASVLPGLSGWRLCADSANTNYLAIGKASDVDTDGVRLGAGQCFACDNCSPSTLKLSKVKGGAASQGYGVVQFKP